MYIVTILLIILLVYHDQRIPNDIKYCDSIILRSREIKSPFVKYVGQVQYWSSQWLGKNIELETGCYPYIWKQININDIGLGYKHDRYHYMTGTGCIFECDKLQKLNDHNITTITILHKYTKNLPIESCHFNRNNLYSKCIQYTGDYIKLGNMFTSVIMIMIWCSIILIILL